VLSVLVDSEDAGVVTEPSHGPCLSLDAGPGLCIPTLRTGQVPIVYDWEVRMSSGGEITQVIGLFSGLHAGFLSNMIISPREHPDACLMVMNPKHE